jgi:hypothetical protein
MIRPTLDKILVDPAVAATPIARAVSRNAGGVEVIEAPAGGVEEALRRLGLTEGKRVLLVKEFRGRSFKQCQGLKEEYACCNLHTLAEGNGCAMECTYCILQHYMTSQHLTVFANVDDLQAEIQRAVSSEPERIFRVGTGELSDSLLLDPLTESTRHMVPFFRSLPNAVLELRTKTDNVENLLDLEHGGKTVVAWSLNPPEVGEREELKTAPLEARLRAASEVARRGYPVGFHLDPLVHYEGWQDGYSRLVAAGFRGGAARAGSVGQPRHAAISSGDERHDRGALSALRAAPWRAHPRRGRQAALRAPAPDRNVPLRRPSDRELRPGARRRAGRVSLHGAAGRLEAGFRAGAPAERRDRDAPCGELPPAIRSGHVAPPQARGVSPSPIAIR